MWLAASLIADSNFFCPSVDLLSLSMINSYTIFRTGSKNGMSLHPFCLTVPSVGGLFIGVIIRFRFVKAAADTRRQTQFPEIWDRFYAWAVMVLPCRAGRRNRNTTFCRFYLPHVAQSFSLPSGLSPVYPAIYIEYHFFSKKCLWNLLLASSRCSIERKPR